MKTFLRAHALVVACATAFAPIASSRAAAAGMSTQDWYIRVESTRKRAESVGAHPVDHIYRRSSGLGSAERPRNRY